MNPDVLIHGVLSSVLGGGGKKWHHALDYLTGRHRSIWTSPATLLTAAGVAWGVYETLQRGSAPPPIPGAPVPPPPDEAVRIVQLAVSAASADGVMSEKERAAILQHARAAGVAEIVERELNHRRPLAEIVAGVTDQAQRATLYVLAFTVLRADEQVSGAERIYLARLAQLLELDPQTVEQLEEDTGTRIDALGDQGQSGG